MPSHELVAKYSRNRKYRNVASKKKLNNLFFMILSLKIGTHYAYELIMQCAKFCSCVMDWWHM